MVPLPDSTPPTRGAPRKLTDEEYDSLIAEPYKADAGTPTLDELDFALSLMMKRYTLEAWYLRRRLKWLVKMMDKHYGVKWTTPWDKRR
jgi:hypothetical protein